MANIHNAALSKLGECIMARLNVTQFVADEAYRSDSISFVRQHKVGGFCVFGGSPEKVHSTVSELQEIARSAHGTPLIFAADCEFGLPMRFAGGTEFPDAMAIARTQDPELAYAVGRAIAKEMLSIGLTWNFAPVCDVNSNPNNPIINTRAFGENPETVIQFAVPMMEGLQSEGVGATAKHFPGHGDTTQDSHKELPFLNASYERFKTIELPPFASLIRAGVQSVMTGHLATPRLAKHLGARTEDDRLPATLSKALTSSLLRQELGFDGVIVTDALEMHAITSTYGEDEAVIRSFEAGTDILLMPPNPYQAFEALSNALHTDRITEQQISERYQRIQRLKLFASLHKAPAKLLSELQPEHETLAANIARQAIEVSGWVEPQMCDLVILTDNRPEAELKAKQFASKVNDIMRSIKIVNIKDSSFPEISEHTIIATFHRARGYLGGDQGAQTMPTVIRKISESLHQNDRSLAGLILIGSPYLDREFQTPPAFVLNTYSESSASINAASERLLRFTK